MSSSSSARELRAALLLGEVQVAVRDAAEDDRDAEERSHRRVVAGKADRAGVVGDVVQAEWPRLPDQDAEDAPPARQLPDRGPRLGVDPGREEPLEALPGAVDHPEGRVTGARQRRRRLDDSLEQGIERELRGERDARLDEHPEALLRRRRGVGVAGVRHRGSVVAPIAAISPQPCGFSLLPLRETAIAAVRVLPSRRAGIAETNRTRGDPWASPRKRSRT